MSTVPLFFDIHNYPLLSLYQSCLPELLTRAAYQSCLPELLTRAAYQSCLTVRGAGTRPTRSATAASWACYGLAMDLLDRARRRHSPYALGHCRELGLLWACYGLA